MHSSCASLFFATTKTSVESTTPLQEQAETTIFARLIVAASGAMVECSSTTSASLERRLWVVLPWREAVVLPQMTPCCFLTVPCDDISLWLLKAKQTQHMRIESEGACSSSFCYDSAHSTTRVVTQRTDRETCSRRPVLDAGAPLHSLTNTHEAPGNAGRGAWS